jgi:hypothetical protein
MDLTNYTIEELIELKKEIITTIENFDDGYVYICKVRSYGRNWEERDITNTHSLQELLYKYDGEHGIVDVYSTNPDLGKIHNYGELYYISSEEDYEKWNRYEVLKQVISQIEKELDNWDNRDNVPFGNRPKFVPIYTRGDLLEYKKRLEEYDTSFKPRVPYKVN